MWQELLVEQRGGVGVEVLLSVVDLRVVLSDDFSLLCDAELARNRPGGLSADSCDNDMAE